MDRDGRTIHKVDIIHAYALRDPASLEALLLVFGSGVMWAATGVIFSQADTKRYDFVTLFAVASLVVVVVSAVFLVDHRALWAGDVERVGATSGVLITAGFLVALGMLASEAGMSRGHHAAVWTIGQSARLAPYFFGVAFFGDALKPIRLAGVFMITASLVMFGFARS